jgi:hypothetical protein
MDASNPYSSPVAEVARGRLHYVNHDHCGWLSLALASAAPIVVAWDYLANSTGWLSQWPMENLFFNFAFTLVVFLATAVAVPLGAIGIMSRRWSLGALGLLAGGVFTVAIFYVKFYPWIVHFASTAR